MYLKIIFTLSLLLPIYSNNYESSNRFVDHSNWDRLLKKHVTDEGWVNYKDFRSDRVQLQSYLEYLSNNPPGQNWSRNDKIAYWINVYNAFTIELILKHYPVESIKDIGSIIQIPFINTPWDIKFIKIGDKEYDLNNIEHSILREKFNEPRIHFALNCASRSCPKLRREAYVGKKLDQQLDEMAIEFINDPSRNIISRHEVQLNKIFSWYKGDFTEGQSLIEYINRYSRIKVNEDAEISYLDYDWSLNSIDNI